MADLNPKQLKNAALHRISQSESDPRRLVLIHTGVIVVLNVLVSGLNLYLNQQIDTTGGLSGLGMRSILETIQTLLGYFSTFFTPFWAAGFLHAMIRVTRGQEGQPKDLLLGFQRFGRIMSHTLWQILIYSTACIAVMYVVCNLFILTPMAADFLAILEPALESPNILLPDGTLNLEALPMDSLMVTMIPLFIMYAAVLIPFLIFTNCQFRMSLFLLVEGMERGAMGSFFVSIKLMKGHKWQMFKLDLSFWWYYLAEALLMLVLYLDLLLPMLGVALPFNETVAFFLALILYGALELGFHYWKKAEVDVTYAGAYEAIYRQFVPAESEQN